MISPLPAQHQQLRPHLSPDLARTLLPGSAFGKGKLISTGVMHHNLTFQKCLSLYTFGKPDVEIALCKRINPDENNM